ncbi:MAG: rRNA pseudouridine synthase [Algoriphagus sp.]|nr:rRNA pseudouridine synthase [Algoriphagus sp.]
MSSKLQQGCCNAMKKNNSKKPFFKEEKLEETAPFQKKNQKGGKEAPLEEKGKFSEKSPFSRQKKETSGSSPSSKGKFFKENRENQKSAFDNSPFKEREEKKYGDSFSKKSNSWNTNSSKDRNKKTFGTHKDPLRGEKPQGNKIRNFGAEEPSNSPKEKYGRGREKKDASSSFSNEKLVYKGRGKDQQPVFGKTEENFSSKPTGEKRGFGKNRSKYIALNADRPNYSFDKVAQQKSTKDGEDLIRLNKYISNSGICSRREADELIQKGLVIVNGEVIKELGYKVRRSDQVVFEGKRINPEKPVYVLLNKPKDFITTTEDPMDRKTVMALVENACEERIFPVGRLDRNTTGLLLFTNDGELAAKLSHPSNEIKKIYQVTLDKALTQKDEEAILEGITLEDGEVKVDDMQVLSKDRTILGLEIHIGRNRIVRRIFAHFGYEVVGLDRVMYAGLDKKDLKRGHYRFLTEQEVIRLKYHKH